MSGEDPPVRLGEIINWSFSPSLSPSLSPRPILSLSNPSLRSHLCYQTLHTKSRTKLAFLLLIAGDISTNPGPTTHSLQISCANVQSIRNKVPTIEAFVHEHHTDCLLLTETWLSLDQESHAAGSTGSTASRVANQCFTPEGFALCHRARSAVTLEGIKSGGGVGCLVDNRFETKTIPTPVFQSFENIMVSVDFQKLKLNLVSLYRPPNKSVPQFFEEFQNFLSLISSLKSQVIITGDFNLHVDVDNPDTKHFKEILSNYNLTQHVNFPTHKLGHTLDLFITPDNFPFLKNITPTESFSDHSSITATLDFQIENRPVHKHISYRPYKKIDMAKFKSDLEKSVLLTDPENNASDLYNQYHKVLSELVNRHAPLTTRTCPSRPTLPWITNEILNAKRAKRKLERIWRKSRFTFDRKSLNSKVHSFNKLISKAKTDFYSKLVNDNKNNPKKLWNSINRLLYRNKSSPLPDCSDNTELANSFGTFFEEKISKIRSVFKTNFTPGQGDDIKPGYNPPPLNNFKPLSQDEVKKLISKAPTKSCDLDPCPTFIIKDCMDILLAPITNIINLSLQEGVFPDLFKKALVTPLLKKPSLPKNDFKNYRPVSNLNFLSKLTEKAVASQIKSHIETFNLDNPFQSAYKAFHSTETALLSVQNDIFSAMERGKVTALTLLDLSAAFDTIDHKVLLDRLSGWFGIGGGALDWIVSYLQNRFQSVIINGSISNPVELLFGVPQGSVLGPLLFIMYTTPLSKVLSKPKDIDHHLYADDTQVWNSLTLNTFENSLSNLQNTLISVQDWMYQNKLKLNPDKTEFLLIGNKCHRNKLLSKFPINLLGNSISPAPKARNLGVYFDEDFNFQNHINSIVKSCNYYIREIKRIRKYLDRDVAVSVANALVSSRIDYCNSLLYGVPAKYILKLQRVQNTLARVVTCSSRYTSASTLLRELHWLPVRSRIQFKINLITFKTLHFNKPASLSKLLSTRNLPINLRSNNAITLNPGPISKSFGTRAFAVYAPKLWNDLPIHVRNANTTLSFRKALKTHYFTNPP